MSTPLRCRTAALAATLALVLGACGSPSSDRAAAPGTTPAPPATTPPPTTRAAPTTTAPQAARPAAETASAAAFARQRVRLDQVATLEAPLAVAAPEGDSALYIAEKGGRVRALRSGRLDPEPVLDLTGEVSTGGEQGLLGIAFSPDRRWLYVNLTDTQGDTRVY